MAVENALEIYLTPGTPLRNKAGDLGTFVGQKTNPDGTIDYRFRFAQTPFSRTCDYIVTRDLIPARFELVTEPLSYAERFCLGLSDKERVLAELGMVGPKKPLGYLRVETIIRMGSSVKEQESKAVKRHLEHYIAEGRSHPDLLGNQFLFVYHPKTLREALDSEREILQKMGWPGSLEVFMNNVANITPPINPDLTRALRTTLGSSIHLKQFPKVAEAEKVTDKSNSKPPQAPLKPAPSNSHELLNAFMANAYKESAT